MKEYGSKLFVLVTLLMTTLADVIGVFSFVAKYLFPKKEGPTA